MNPNLSGEPSISHEKKNAIHISIYAYRNKKEKGTKNTATQNQGELKK